MDSRQKELLQLAYQPGVKFHRGRRAELVKARRPFYKTIQRMRGGPAPVRGETPAGGGDDLIHHGIV